jgi:3-methyladenine DNA glycosylase Mpg
MLNFATAGQELPEGVLIRGILADPHGAAKYLAGPGRVTQWLKIDKTLDGKGATVSRQIWIEDRGISIPQHQRKRGPRVGVGYPGEYWAARPWRFWIDSATANQILAAVRTRTGTVRSISRPLASLARGRPGLQMPYIWHT